MIRNNNSPGLNENSVEVFAAQEHQRYEKKTRGSNIEGFRSLRTVF